MFVFLCVFEGSIHIKRAANLDRMALKDIKIRSTKGNVKLYQGSSCKGRKLGGIKGALSHDRVRSVRNSVQLAFTASDPMRCSLCGLKRAEFLVDKSY
jgi:hypothetical protein